MRVGRRRTCGRAKGEEELRRVGPTTRTDVAAVGPTSPTIGAVTDISVGYETIFAIFLRCNLGVLPDVENFALLVRSVHHAATVTFLPRDANARPFTALAVCKGKRRVTQGACEVRGAGWNPVYEQML